MSFLFQRIEGAVIGEIDLHLPGREKRFERPDYTAFFLLVIEPPLCGQVFGRGDHDEDFERPGGYVHICFGDFPCVFAYQ